MLIVIHQCSSVFASVM